MVDNPNPQNAKPSPDRKDDKQGQNRGDASDTSNRAGQRAATQQGGSKGTADNVGAAVVPKARLGADEPAGSSSAVHESRGEHERLTRTSHEEKS